MKLRWKKKAALFLAAVMLGGVVNPFSHTAGSKTYAAGEENADAAEKNSMDGWKLPLQAQADNAQAYNAGALQPEMEKNLNYQNYGVYGSMVSSYLVETEGGFMRVQQVKEKSAPVIEYYDEQFRLKSQQYIQKELDGFAGFYAGGDYYYIAWVQALPAGIWAKDKPFLRVVKYDKNWNVQVYGDITSEDLKNEMGVVYLGQGGSLRMSEYQGHLYINTCYEGIDTHQRSVVLDLIEEDMSFVKLEVNSVASYYGRASHSFNQFLLIDEGLTPKRMVTLNQGDNADAGQRGAALEQCVLYTDYPSAVSSADKKLVNAFPCAGGKDNNFVGMSLGGLEQSQSSYVIAGNSIEQAEATFLTAKQRNIFVTAVSRTNFTKENTTLTWLTDYKEGDGVEISTPQLVKMSDHLFLVMWRVGGQADYIAGEMAYTFVDGSGRRCAGSLGRTRTVKAEITDCRPIVKDGRAVWYSSGVEGVYFYSIDERGSFQKHGVNTMEEIPALKKAEIREDGMYFEWEPVEHAAGYRIIRRYKTEAGEDFCRDVKGGETSRYLDTKMDFQDDCSYDFFVCALDENGVPSYASNVMNKWIFRGIYKSQVSLENAAEGVKVNWNTLPDVEFRIYRSSADKSDEKLIATVKGPAQEDYTLREVQSYTDTTAESGVPYDYSISVYSKGHESVRFNKHSIIYLPKPKVSAECTVHNVRNTVTLSWNKVPGAAEYTVVTEVWNEESGKYEKINMGKSFSEDKLSCVIYGASEGKKYRFIVWAQSETIQTSSMQYSNSFRGEWTETVLAYVRPEADPLPAPSIISVENTSNGVKLVWSPIEGVDGYEVNIYSGSQEPRTEILGADTEYVDMKAAEGSAYAYKVRGYVQNGGTKIYSGWSNEQAVTYVKPAQPPAAVLSAPSFTSVENAASGVKLAWTPVEGADGYEVNAYDSIQGSRTVILRTTECEDARAAEGTAYAYKVRAYAQRNGSKIYSDWSEVKNITHQKPGSNPDTDPVMELQAPSFASVENTNEGVRLAWTLVKEADGYEIQVSNNKNVRVRTVALGAVAYAYVEAAEGIEYTYKIRAYAQRDGVRAYSGWSAGKSITYQKPSKLPTPQITSIKNTENGVMLTWNEVEGAQGYWVYYYDPDNNKFQLIASPATAGYTDEKAEEGKTYYYVVFAHGKNIQSRQSEPVSIQYKNPQPGTPVLKNLTCLEEGVKVEWEPAEGAEGYDVYFYEAGISGGAYSYKKIKGGSVNSAVVGYPSDSEGKTYGCYVVAYNSEAQSRKSNIKSIVIKIPGYIPPDNPTLSAPNLRTASCFKDAAGSGIELTWTLVPGADGYIIYVYEDGLLTSDKTINGGSITSCRFYNLKEDTVYIFGMRAYKDTNSGRKLGGESNGKVIRFITPSEITDPTDPTDPDTPTPKPPSDTLAAPKLLEVKCVSGGVKITWEPVEGAEGYFVKYYKAKNPQEILIQRVEGQDTVSFLHQYVYLTEGETYVYSVAAYTNTPTYKIGEYSDGRSIVYEKPEVMLGDVNGDGKITIEDAICILKDVAKLSNPVFNKEAADCNKDGKITIEDAIMVLKHTAKIIQIS